MNFVKHLAVVSDAPEVSVTELVHVENAAELLCSVDAHPTAKESIELV